MVSFILLYLVKLIFLMTKPKKTPCLLQIISVKNEIYRF